MVSAQVQKRVDIISVLIKSAIRVRSGSFGLMTIESFRSESTANLNRIMFERRTANGEPQPRLEVRGKLGSKAL